VPPFVEGAGAGDDDDEQGDLAAAEAPPAPAMEPADEAVAPPLVEDDDAADVPPFVEGAGAGDDDDEDDAGRDSTAMALMRLQVDPHCNGWLGVLFIVMLFLAFTVLEALD
jgi:hypothetical protein